VSIEDTETAAAANATAPRISLADIENNIVFKFYTTGERIVADTPTTDLHGDNLVTSATIGGSLAVLSICLLVMRNGFTVIGKSAPASEANYNADLGKSLAYEDAIRQLWPLMGFTLRTRIHEGW